MKHKRWIERAAIAVLSILLAFFSVSAGQKAVTAGAQGGTVKWADFNVPLAAMQYALKLDIQTHTTTAPLHFADALAFLAAKYGGNWNRYRSADLDALRQQLQSGQTMQDITASMKNYSYFNQVYDAVLGNAVGDYATGAGGNYTEQYGLKLFSPIAAGYGYGHYDDFGNSRSFGFSRRHLGNDLMGTVGTPICAVEGGYVEELGWNKYGGWRIGIRSFDKKRYYYYAHLRKGHPYRTGLVKGEAVQSGEVIGYLGMTGYSNKEDVNGMNKPHLHFGMELVFDESQKESNNEIWIDVYNIVNFLAQNRTRVIKSGNDFNRTTDFLDLRYLMYYD
ncbi:MAG: M23 family metallopeptidase [Ethanoligenens sp.]